MNDGSPQLQRVLYIEDEEDIRLVAQIALEQIGGLTTKTCASGPEGLEAVDTFVPELILLDVMMPGMDGPSVLGKLRQRHASNDIPVVFITAKVQPDEVHRFKEMGAEAVITKPFEPMTLAAQLQEIWSHFHAHRK